MRTEDLIADLVGRVTPVRPLPSPGRRAIAWLALASMFAAAGIAIFGPRPDVMQRLTQSDYLRTATLALGSSMCAVVVTLVLAIPGAERNPAFRLLTVGLFALWAVTMMWAVVSAGRGLPITTDPHWPACFARVALISAGPAYVLFAMVRRALPLRLGWAAGFAAAAAAAIAALAVQIICPLDDAGHALLGHFVPVIVIALIGVAARSTMARRRTYD